MRTIPPALQAALDSGAATIARAWLLRLKDGATLGFTDHDRPLAVEGVTCAPDAALEPSAIQSVTGLTPDDLTVQGALSDTALTDADLARGRLDGAEADLWLVDWTDPEARMLLFRGSVGEVTRGRLGFSAELRGLSHALDQPQGRAFLRTCDAELGDARCRAARRSEEATVAALAPGGFDAPLTREGYADGLLTWTSGPNAGLRQPVKDQREGRVEWWAPPPERVAPGDGFTIAEGCDKTWETCRDRFGNTPNFRGFPDIPGDDAAMAYPRQGDRNDGAVL